MNVVQGFFKKNLWNLIISLIFISMAWSAFNFRLSNVEAQVQENKKQIIEYSELVKRVIRLEENREVVTDDIKEIKADLKDLKEYFNLR